MKKVDLGQTINTLANIGVIAGLIFVGWQLHQDREIAESDVLLRGAEYTMLWADLLEQGSDIWAKGLNGEPLTQAEEFRFDALAQAWEFRLYSSFEIGSRYDLELPARFARQAALDIHESPGLRSWWVDYRVRQREVSRNEYDPWEEAVNAALQDLEAR